MLTAMSQINYQGSPRTSEEWAALAKIGRGQTDVPKEALRRLFMLGLVHRQLGRVCLTEHGRSMLRSLYGSPMAADALASDMR